MDWIAHPRRFRALPAVAGGAVLLVLAWAVLAVATPNGDPGGRILGELRPASAAIPAAAAIGYRQEVEPRWDSCDGRPGTFGWDDVAVIVHFTTTLSAEAVRAHADSALRALGWKVDSSLHQGDVFSYSWTKELFNGTTTWVQVSNEGQDPRVWDLAAGAPPVGPRASGC